MITTRAPDGANNMYVFDVPVPFGYLHWIRRSMDDAREQTKYSSTKNKTKSELNNGLHSSILWAVKLKVYR